MKTNNITFEQAFGYLFFMSKYIKLSVIAKKTGVCRTTLSTCLNKTKNRYGDPNMMPVKHQETIIDFVESIQLEQYLEWKGNNSKES